MQNTNALPNWAHRRSKFRGKFSSGGVLTRVCYVFRFLVDIRTHHAYTTARTQAHNSLAAKWLLARVSFESVTYTLQPSHVIGVCSLHLFISKGLLSPVCFMLSLFFNFIFHCCFHVHIIFPNAITKAMFTQKFYTNS